MKMSKELFSPLPDDENLCVYASEYGNSIHIQFPTNDPPPDVGGYSIDDWYSGSCWVNATDFNDVDNVVQHLRDSRVPCDIQVINDQEEVTTIMLRVFDGKLYAHTHRDVDEDIHIDTILHHLNSQAYTALLIMAEKLKMYSQTLPFTEVDKDIFQAYLLNQKLGLTK